MTEMQRRKMEHLVRSNLIASTGCTEPIAIAHAAAKARETLNEEPSSIKVKLSDSMIKNAMDAVIPGTKHVGAGYAAALGGLYGETKRGFELLEDLTGDQREKAFTFAEKHVNVSRSNTEKELYIEIIMEGNNFINRAEGERCLSNARVVVTDTHKHIQLIELNGVIQYIDDPANSDAGKKDKASFENATFSMKEVYEYVESLKDFSSFKKAIELNKALSEEGKKNLWGLNSGKEIPFGEDTKVSRIISATAAGIDARMGGAPLAAMACTGSGNQGITATMSVYQVAQELNSDEATTLKAVAISCLADIYVKQNLNVLSHLCGAVIASTGASAGIAYLMGGDYKVAEYAMQGVLTTLTGMFCDGAKGTCALKVLACINTAIYSASMAFNANSRIETKIGISSANIADTINNIALIEQRSFKMMTATILEIIMK